MMERLIAVFLKDMVFSYTLKTMTFIFRGKSYFLRTCEVIYWQIDEKNSCNQCLVT